MAARKRDPAALLAEQLVDRLRQLAATPGSPYPLTLHELVQLVDPRATPRLILAAAGPRRKEFTKHAIVARSDLLAPVALLDDVPVLAESRILLEYTLGACRTTSNQAFTPSVLRARLTGRLQKAFQDALIRHIEEGTLPPTIGWVLISRSRKLFLMSDLHQGSVREHQPPPTGIVAAPLDFATAFDTAFRSLDQQEGGHNFVSLTALRRALPLERPDFDRELRGLRAAGRYSLSAAEGRHGLTEEDRAAGIMEDGTLLLYVSKRTPT